MGTLLGDACIPLNRGKPSLRVDFIQTIAPYIWIYGIYMTFFQKPHFVGTPPQVRDVRGGGARDRQSLGFQTFGPIKWSG